MTMRLSGALRRRLASSAVAGLVALATLPAATAQWAPAWGWAAPPADIEQRLEAQGYVLVAPLRRRPGIYLADVRAGPTGYQRLVIDARSGDILERFIAPPRTEYGVRFNGFGGLPPQGAFGPPGFSVAPNGGPPMRSAEGGPPDVRIPSAVSPFGSQFAPSLTKPKPKSAATDRKTPPNKTAPGAIAPTAAPPLPPPAPREAVKPDESAPPAAPTPEPKSDSPPGDSQNASTANAPATPTTNAPATSAAANVEPQPQAPAAASQSLDSAQEPAAAPSSSVEASDKAKISVVPAALFE